MHDDYWRRVQQFCWQGSYMFAASLLHSLWPLAAVYMQAFQRAARRCQRRYMMEADCKVEWDTLDVIGSCFQHRQIAILRQEQQFDDDKNKEYCKGSSSTLRTSMTGAGKRQHLRTPDLHRRVATIDIHSGGTRLRPFLSERRGAVRPCLTDWEFLVRQHAQIQ